MKISYQGKTFEVEDGACGFVVAKLVDPEKKNKALGAKVGDKIPDSDKTQVQADIAALKEILERTQPETMTDSDIADIKAKQESLMKNG